MSDPRAMAYLDGGPATGQVVQLDEPEWAPIGAIRVEVDGVEVVYVRVAGEPQGSDGTWRYVPAESAPARGPSSTSMIDDPFDD
jgi:hypothetical protein